MVVDLVSIPEQPHQYQGGTQPGHRGEYTLYFTNIFGLITYFPGNTVFCYICDNVIVIGINCSLVKMFILNYIILICF